MLNNNGHQKPSCAFAEAAAAYLYDEIDGAEKLNFQSHLRDCKACADELANFSALRSSIADWREMSFEILPTPAFAMSFADKTNSEKRSWFESARAFFNFSPAWSTTAIAAFVALIMFGVFFWFAVNYSRRDELANNKTIQNAVPTPPTEIFSGSKMIAPADNAAALSGKLPKSAPVAAKADAVQNAAAPVKVFAKTAAATKSNKSSAPIPDRENQPTAPAKNSVPAVIGDDDEDNSLRLSDMFDEVGMNKSPEDKND